MADNDKFRIKPRFNLVAHSPDHVELRSGVWSPSSFVLEDSSQAGHLYRVLRSLDGSRSAKEIASNEGIPRADVEAVIDQLRALDAIETAAGSALDDYVTAYVPTLRNPDPNLEPIARLLVLGDDNCAARVRDLLCGTLPDVGVDLLTREDAAWRQLMDADEGWLNDGLLFERYAEQFQSWAGALVVHVAGALHPPRLRRLNRVTQHLGISWIHGALDGPFLLVGPTFIPNRTPCFECLELRVLMNMRDAGNYQDYKHALVSGAVSGAPWTGTSIASAILAAHVALESLNFTVTRSSFTMGKLLSLYIPTMEFVFHDVLRVPTCPACGSLGHRDDRELYFDIRTLVD